MTSPIPLTLIPWAVVHDIDGCLILGKDGKPTWGTTLIARYNDALDFGEALRTALERAPALERALHTRPEVKLSTPEDIAAFGDWALYDTGLITRDDLVAIKAIVNQGLPEEAMHRAIGEIRFTPYVETFARYVRNNGGKQIVVTDGWHPVALYVAEKLKFDYAEGNKPVFENGRFTGRVERIDKESVIEQKLSEYGVTHDRTVGIDDANAFITKYGLAIAFYPKDEQRFTGYPNVRIVKEVSYRPVLDWVNIWVVRNKIVDKVNRF